MGERQPELPTPPRILLIDIETFPNLAFVWGKWQQDAIDFEREWCIATFAAKWLGEPVFARALPDYKGYKAGSYNDRSLVIELHRLLDAADIVIAHNGNSFDVKKMNARFIYHKLKPPSPYKTIDTKVAAKKVARFNSNKLDDLGKHLGEGKKIKTDFELWLGCINGDRNAWARMVRYNKQDVVLLEKVYLRLRPWIGSHPNLGLYGSEAQCPKCGSTELQFRGFHGSATRRYRRFQCLRCFGWGRVVHGSSGVEHTNIL